MASDGPIVNLGVAPYEPSTAYGYIAAGEPLGAVRRLDAFVEKPDALTAQEYIVSGHLWSSGNFVVSAQPCSTSSTATPLRCPLPRAIPPAGSAKPGISVPGQCAHASP